MKAQQQSRYFVWGSRCSGPITFRDYLLSLPTESEIQRGYDQRLTVEGSGNEQGRWLAELVIHLANGDEINNSHDVEEWWQRIVRVAHHINGRERMEEIGKRIFDTIKKGM